MKLLMTHGYMLSGTGSNIYVQNLCRALVRGGHEVHLLCQEERPLDYEFVDEHASVDGDDIERLGERETPQAARCVVYNPRIDGLLPVYVYDDYPGWRVKTFLDLTDEELENYMNRNAEAVGAVLRATGAEAVVTNHSVPGPLIARRALRGGRGRCPRRRGGSGCGLRAQGSPRRSCRRCGRRGAVSPRPLRAPRG